jgi:hypothetical protein
LISTWFIKKHAPILSYIIGLTPILGTIIVLYFWFQYKNVKVKKRQILKYIKNNLGKSILILIIIIYEIFFIAFIIPNAKKGFPRGHIIETGFVLYEASLWKDTLEKFKSFYESFYCVDLSYQKLITEPEKDYKGIYWLDLNGAHLEGASLISTVLKRVNLQGAQIQYAGMWNVILQEADLSYANLQGADLSGANLHSADLYETNLRGTILWHANFQGADLTNAKLQGAYLWGATLQEAINLTVEQLSEVKTLYEAELDPEIEKVIKEKYPHLLEKPEWLKEEEDEE